MWIERYWGAAIDFFAEEFFANSLLLFILFFATLVALIVAAVIAVRTESTGLYIGVAAVAAGAGFATVALGCIRAENAALCFSVLLSLGGAIYLCVLAAVGIRRAKRRKKRAAEEAVRKLQYALPDRENSFVRTRLNTVLRTQEQPTEKTTVEETEMERSNGVFRVSYARKMLAKLMEAPLSPHDRLRAEDMSKLFSAYVKKENWTVNDVRMLNDAFSCLLKMSAKYSV